MQDENSKFVEIEKRLEALEKIVFSKDVKKLKKKDYSGLRGGIHHLIDNGYFEQPRNLKEIEGELKREGYHYPKPSISKALSVDLTNKQKVLNRIKEENNWKYVIRK